MGTAIAAAAPARVPRPRSRPPSTGCWRARSPSTSAASPCRSTALNRPPPRAKRPVVLLVRDLRRARAHCRCGAALCQGITSAWRPSSLCARAMRPTSPAVHPELEISKVPDAQVMKDLDACLAWAGANGGDLKRSRHRAGGGRITWLCRPPGPREGRCGLVRPPGRQQPALDAAAPGRPWSTSWSTRAGAPTRRCWKTPASPTGTVAQMQEKLKASKNSNASTRTSCCTPRRAHAFHADYRPVGSTVR